LLRQWRGGTENSSFASRFAVIGEPETPLQVQSLSRESRHGRFRRRARPKVSKICHMQRIFMKDCA
jgi:hypothetical protein